MFQYFSTILYVRFRNSREGKINLRGWEIPVLPTLLSSSLSSPSISMLHAEKRACNIVKLGMGLGTRLAYTHNAISTGESGDCNKKKGKGQLF